MVFGGEDFCGLNLELFELSVAFEPAVHFDVCFPFSFSGLLVWSLLCLVVSCLSVLLVFFSLLYLL